MKEIKLTKNKIAIVDDSDYIYLSKKKWYFKNNSKTLDTGYASSRSGYMHRIIMKAKSGEYVDHINGNKLDNRKSNLRICTMSQNKANSYKYSTNKSGYKGVYWHKSVGKWSVQVRCNGKLYSGGYFLSKEQAHKARISMSKKLFMEFAK